MPLVCVCKIAFMHLVLPHGLSDRLLQRRQRVCLHFLGTKVAASRSNQCFHWTRGSGSERVIVLLCNKSLLGGFVKVTNLPYLEGFCYVTKPSTWRVGVT